MARGAGTMVAENFGGAVCGCFGGRAHDDYRAALLDVRGVKFLVADVVGLAAGIGANGFEGAALAEETSEPIGIRGRRVGGFFAGGVDGARVVVGIGDELHLPAGNAGEFQILNRFFAFAIATKNSDDDVFHGELLSSVICASKLRVKV